MTATIVPRTILCSCGEPMHIEITSRTCTCLNDDCAERGVSYELPLTEVELTPTEG